MLLNIFFCYLVGISLVSTDLFINFKDMLCVMVGNLAVPLFLTDVCDNMF